MTVDKVSFHQFIESFIEILETKDTYTRGHSNRVAHYSVAIARAMELTKEEIDLAHISGHLHDIGKIGISDNILLKTGRLTDEEYESIKKHSDYGYNILSKVEVLSEHAVIIKHHHERWDGKGYPSNLKEDEIPLISRIISVADAFDAMTSSRSYRKSLTFSAASEELKKNIWSQFDGSIVDIFLKKILPNLNENDFNRDIKNFI